MSKSLRAGAAAGNPTETHRPGITAPILITLALLAAVAPFATDLYLPAFPKIAAGLATSATGVQLSLTTFLLGAALGQLLFGPLSDRYGRVPPVVVGSIVCAAASAVAALSPSISFLIGVRLIQGVAGSAGMVVGRAIVSDLAGEGQQAARAFSLMMTVVGIAPILAPWLGSLIVGPLGWRGTLWVIFAIALITLGAVLAFIRESHPAQARARQASHGAQLGSLLSRRFLGYSLAFSLAFAAMMAYISASPFLFQTVIGLSVVQYGLLFALIAVFLTASGVASARLVGRIPAHRLLGIGLAILVAASALLAGIVFLGMRPVWTILPIAIAVGSLGLVFGNATSLAVAAVPRAVGAGSALLGAMQFGFGALVAPLVGVRGEHTAGPLALVMLAASVLALMAFCVAEGNESPVRRQADEEDAMPSAACGGE